MEKCTFCEHPINENDKYCRFCGKATGTTESRFSGTAYILETVQSRFIAWLISGYQLWEKNPVYYLGFGLLLMFVTIMPGLNILAFICSGAIIGIFFKGIGIVEKGETITFSKIERELSSLWGYILVVQLIVLIILLAASIVYWIPALLIAPFFLFVVPVTLKDLLPLSEIFAKSVQMGRNNYILLLTATIFIFLINWAAYSLLPILLFLTIPYSLTILYSAFNELEAEYEETEIMPSNTVFID